MTQVSTAPTEHMPDHGANLEHIIQNSSSEEILPDDPAATQQTDSDPDLFDLSSPIDRRLTEEDVESVVGVSIGKAQSHYKSRQTPAAEKSKALEDDEEEFASQEGLDADAVHLQVTERPTQVAKERQPIANTIRQNARPSPIQVSGQPPQGRGGLRSETSRSILRDSLTSSRRRSFSSAMAVAEGLRKLFNDMPSISLPKSPSFASFNLTQKFKDTDFRPRRSNTVLVRGSNSWLQSPPEGQPRPARVPERDHRPPFPSSARRSSSHLSQLRGPATAAIDGSFLPNGYTSPSSRPHSLRRATSDNSLYMRKELSRTSTLEDVDKWEHVQEQVNSRLKAIKDSFHDSALRNLPKMPSMDLSSFKPSFIGRNESDAIASQTRAVSGTGPRRPLTSSVSDQPQRTSQSVGSNGNNGEKNTYPSLTQALTELHGDVVVLGGYRGSILRSATPPHRQVWVPVKVGLNLRKVDLEVGLNDEDEERMEEKIIPSGVLSHIGPVDICRRLLKKLVKSPNAASGTLRVHDYGYDWRLSPGLLVRRLIQFLEKLECNQPGTPKQQRGATVIAHSLGGLIVRAAVNQRPDLFAGVLYAGVPQHCVNILGPLRNGDDVLFSSRVLTAQVNFSLRTSFALLPESGRCFFNKKTQERYDVDFFDPMTWEEHRLSPCLKPALPPYRGNDSRKSIIDTVSDSIASLPKRASVVLPRESSSSALSKFKDTIEQGSREIEKSTLEPNMPSNPLMNSFDTSSNSSNSVATRVTLSHDEAFEYLARTLARVLAFKRSLAFIPDHQSSNVYPPAAVLYAKNTPTVYGARVASREAIKHSDAYDDLAFAAGDGVVLANAAMLPEGYRLVKGGLARSERGHVGLLGDLEGVGKCLLALIAGRSRGVGLGLESENQPVATT